MLPRESVSAMYAGVFSYSATSRYFFKTKLHLGKSNSSGNWKVKWLGELKGITVECSSLLVKVRQLHYILLSRKILNWLAPSLFFAYHFY